MYWIRTPCAVLSTRATQVEVIRLLVSSYFDIVRHNLADMVPKCLMRHLVHHSQRGMQQHLIAALYRCGAARARACGLRGTLAVCAARSRVGLGVGHAYVRVAADEVRRPQRGGN